MKILMKPIELIAWFTGAGVPTPLKFRYSNEEKEYITIRVDKILLREEEKLAGNIMFIYRCQSLIDGMEKIFELKYELKTCKWFLYKI